MSDLRTISPDELPDLSEIPEDLRAVVFSPTGPFQAVPFEKLLTKLIATNLAKTSKAALDADLAHPANSVALVFSDPAILLNGWYRKNGAAGAGDWEQFEELSRNARNVALAAAAAAELARDVAQTARSAAVKARTDTEAARDTTIAAASDVDGIEFPRFSSAAALLADVLITGSVAGRTWLGGGVSFTEAASTAIDHHVTTAGGIKLYVVPSYGYAKPIYEAAAFGITPALTGAALSDAVNAAFAKIPPFTALRLGAGDYLPSNATVGTVLPNSAQGGLGFVPGAFYLDKPGQELIGAGFATHINGNNQSLHLVMCRASHQRVKHLRYGNVRGELVTAEAAGVCIEPSNNPRINPMGGDIEDIEVDDCDIYECENAVTAHPEAYGNLAEPASDPITTERFTAFYRAKKVKVKNCRLTKVHRTGVEFFQCDDSEVTNTVIVIGQPSGGLPSGFETVRRGLRGIGSARVKFTGNTVIYTEAASTDVYGVDMSLGAFYGLSPQSAISKDFDISVNHFMNMGRCIRIEQSLGAANILGNTAYMGDIVARFIEVASAGVLTFDPRLKLKAGLIKAHGNIVVGGTHFGYASGAVDQWDLLDNTYIGGDVDDAFLLEYNMTPNADPDINALERVPITNLRGNTCITKPNISAPPVLITGLKAGDMVYFDDNKLTPSAAGRIIGAGFGANDATVITQSLTSNERLPAGEWAARYNPMATAMAERLLL